MYILVTPGHRHRNQHYRFVWDARNHDRASVCSCHDAVSMVVVFARECPRDDKWFDSFWALSSVVLAKGQISVNQWCAGC